MTAPKRSEKIIISSQLVQPSKQSVTENPIQLSRRWRITGVGLTTLGGLLAFACLSIVLMAPKLLADFFVRGFWNHPYGSRNYSVFSDFIFLAMYDQDYGYIGSYLIGILVSCVLFYCLSQVLEYLGFPVYREGE